MDVFVYYNLHRKCLSVRAKSGPLKNRVIAHAHALFLQDAFFKVQEAGRQRVLRERAKNVHAGVGGKLLSLHALKVLQPTAFKGEAVQVSSEQARMEGHDPSSSAWTSVTYNPYLYDSFVSRDTRQRVQTASFVAIQGADIRAKRIS